MLTLYSDNAKQTPVRRGGTAKRTTPKADNREAVNAVGRHLSAVAEQL